MIYFIGGFFLIFGLILFGFKDDYEVETCEKEGYKNY
jgi:hypothetical protein